MKPGALALALGAAVLTTLAFDPIVSFGSTASESGWLSPRDTVDPIPSSIREEHEEIRRALERATREPGRTGEAARALAVLMEPHFVKEEELALPPLAILPALAADRVTPGMGRVATLAMQLEDELPAMIEEHRVIGAAVGEMAAAARAAGQPEIEAFAERILHHARTEEEITYPAAIVAGRYARKRLAE